VKATAKPVRYGRHRSQLGDLWMPAGERDAKFPVVVFIHGGFWRAMYTKVLMNALARSVSSMGWAAWNIEYRKVGAFGGGGGWPQTFQDVSKAIDRLEGIERLDTGRVVTCGHSAGGHLALWAAGRDQLSEEMGFGPVAVPVKGAISLAGVVDLQAADRLGLGNDATARFLGGHCDERPEVYCWASPAAMLPIGVPQVLLHGLEDTVVPPTMSENYEVIARKAGDEVTYLPLAGLGHRELIDPSGSAWEATLGALDKLLS
jgi:acetyl esterase/lipase